MKRQPPWTIDEWILGLDTYFKLTHKEIRHNNPLIIELSQTLRSLPIHGDARNNEVFRNVNGMVMQLWHFIQFNSSCEGPRLYNHSNLQKRVWDMYSQDRQFLRETAMAIKCSLPLPFEFSQTPDMDEDNFPYGKILYQYHRYIENTSQSTKEYRKEQEARHLLQCEVCEFDFYITYGEVGRGFIEVHHLLDITEYKREMVIKTSDFIMVCSNCHRMLHRISKPIDRYEIREKGLRCIIMSGTPRQGDTY